MWSLTTTTSAIRKLARAAAGFLVMIAAAGPLRAQVEAVHVPAAVVAGTGTTIITSGSGNATLYLLGPGETIRREVELGGKVSLSGQDVHTAGRYLLIVCAGDCRNAAFYVTPSTVASLSFLVHPSRVPVGQPDALSGVAFPFDRYGNLLLAPATINFALDAGGQNLFSRSVTAKDGVAWFRTNSGSHAGTVRVVASSGESSTHRILQQVASDPCNLRVKAERSAKFVELETEPVRDCAGNPVPDGTIVTFREVGTAGTSTVDAPVKQGIARAQMLANGDAVVSVASGVVMGNEIRLGAQK